MQLLLKKLLWNREHVHELLLYLSNCFGNQGISKIGYAILIEMFIKIKTILLTGGMMLLSWCEKKGSHLKTTFLPDLKNQYLLLNDYFAHTNSFALSCHFK
jgi:hypothetical protein